MSSEQGLKELSEACRFLEGRVRVSVAFQAEQTIGAKALRWGGFNESVDLQGGSSWS
mgnify:CR=1 FL=1